MESRKITGMYQAHPLFKDPEGNSSIWRYFSFTKLMSLLETRSLFFPRADTFEDPFEGSWPKLNVAEREKIRAAQLVQKDPQITEEETRKALTKDSEFYRSTREFTLLSCWHYNNSESAAMWKLFPKSDDGVAVRTSVDRFKEAFSAYPEPIYMGMVNYIDYEFGHFCQQPDSPFVAYIHKRKQFEHEKEYRAIILLQPDHEWVEEGAISGIYVPVDINVLIEQIYVAPDAPEWYFRLIRKMLKGFGLDKEVVPSSLSLKPVF